MGDDRAVNLKSGTTPGLHRHDSPSVASPDGADEEPIAAEEAEGASGRHVPHDSGEDSFLRELIEEALPGRLEQNLERLVGSSMPASEGAHRYDIVAVGRFDGEQSQELLGYVKRRKLSCALIIGEHDEERVLYFSRGSLVGAASTVLFETLGRLLFQAGALTREDSRTLVDAEEVQGVQSLLMWIPSLHLRWAVERRVWEAVAGICLVKRGHFLLVGGEPALEGPTVYLDPVAVAEEGLRRKQAWVEGASKDGDTYVPPSMPAPPPPISRRLRPIAVDPETMQEILTRIREAESAAE